MKIRPLPEIDLARLAPLPEPHQRKLLAQFRDGWPPISYRPLRSCLPDILNVQPELFEPVAATEWSVVEALVSKECRSEEERVANLSAVRGLHQFALDNNLLGRAQMFFPMAMGVGQHVVYWLPLVLVLNGGAFVPFLDPRRSHGLTREGRRFVFSMMHERIRVVDPDFASVQLAIIQFGNVDGDRRDPVIHTDDGVELYSHNELEKMVGKTYEIWREVYEARETATRRDASGRRRSLI